MKFDSSQLQSRFIHKGGNLPRAHRVFWGGITGVFWLVYFYLWLPLVTLAMWWFGIDNALVELYLAKGAVDTYVLMALPVIALVCATVLSAWAEYNRRRFQCVERRKAVEAVGIEMMAAGLGADIEVAAAMRAAKHMTLTMSEQATPMAVREHAACPPRGQHVPGRRAPGQWPGAAIAGEIILEAS